MKKNRTSLYSMGDREMVKVNLEKFTILLFSFRKASLNFAEIHSQIQCKPQRTV